MLNGITHRISAVLLALLMLLSSAGFSIDLHYCQDSLAGISILGKADCGMQNMQSLSCDALEDNSIQGLCKAEKHSCCHNKSIVIKKVDSDATKSFVVSSQNLHWDFVIPCVAFNVYHPSVQIEPQVFKYYKPPSPEKDIQVIYQRFLI